MVIDSDKSIVVLFYAPWCGRSKTILNQFEETALKYSKDRVIFGKCDATENEIEGVEIQKYPTIRFWGKNSK